MAQNFNEGYKNSLVCMDIKIKRSKWATVRNIFEIKNGVKNRHKNYYWNKFTSDRYVDSMTYPTILLHSILVNSLAHPIYRVLL